MRHFPRHPLHTLAMAILIISFSAMAQAQESMQRWQKFDFAKSALKPADVANVPLEDLKLMRGIVFGRHGRVFKDAEIATYLTAQDWYKPNHEFQNTMLNGTERRNLDIIRDGEAGKHVTV